MLSCAWDEEHTINAISCLFFPFHDIFQYLSFISLLTLSDLLYDPKKIIILFRSIFLSLIWENVLSPNLFIRSLVALGYHLPLSPFPMSKMGNHSSTLEWLWNPICVVLLYPSFGLYDNQFANLGMDQKLNCCKCSFFYHVVWGIMSFSR